MLGVQPIERGVPFGGYGPGVVAPVGVGGRDPTEARKAGHVFQIDDLGRVFGLPVQRLGEQQEEVDGVAHVVRGNFRAFNFRVGVVLGFLTLGHDRLRIGYVRVTSQGAKIFGCSQHKYESHG